MQYTNQKTKFKPDFLLVSKFGTWLVKRWYSRTRNFYYGFQEGDPDPKLVVFEMLGYYTLLDISKRNTVYQVERLEFTPVF